MSVEITKVDCWWKGGTTGFHGTVKLGNKNQYFVFLSASLKLRITDERGARGLHCVCYNVRA